MSEIVYSGNKLKCEPGETVLECLLRNGIDHPHSCRNGSCQTCMARMTNGNVPEKAIAPLKPTLQEQGYFLPCICIPEGNLEIESATPPGRMAVTVSHLRPLGRDLLQVGLKKPTGFDYRPGQFINLHHDAKTSRSYSLASHPTHDDELVLHVRRFPEGRVSGWIHDNLSPGDTVEVSGPLGDSFYVPGQMNQPLMLIGTGTGLAPLYGIVRDALHHGHQGPIRLFHGARHVDGLYLTEELKALERKYSHFRYVSCVSKQIEESEHAAGRALDVALQQHPELKGWRVYLCGNPDMVKTARKRTFLAGAAMHDIYADAFTASKA